MLNPFHPNKPISIELPMSLYMGLHLHRSHPMVLVPIPGLPPGVVNVVFGVGPKAGEAMVSHPEVPLISFTGSTVVGKRIMSVGSEHIKKLSLEVGIIHTHVHTNIHTRTHTYTHTCTHTCTHT